MINFIDETGKQHSAIVECKKTKGVNGEKSLTGTIYTNDEILEGIGRGWRLQFEDENYCLTYANPIDEGTRIVVEFDAVHEFFFDMSKSVVYAELNGSNTAGAYLDFIFKGSGYEYHLEVTIPAFEKESFGMKNRLDLFKDFVSSTGVEFSVSGKIVRILEKVGSNLSTIVKKGFNLNELRIEKNIGNFITYLKGYGAYSDPEDQTKGRLEVEYLSPLSSIYGKLEGDPIADERYKNATSLTTRLKNEIESSYGISVDIDMEDLTKAGYEYDQPHEGDYIMAINKDLGFEQKIRIMSYTTSYDTEGNIIDHDVSCGSDNLVSQVTKSDNDFRKNVQAGLENAVNTANQAWISADGKNKVFTGTDEPVATNNGDIWYQVDGEKTIMKFWNGYEWQEFIDPKAVQQAAENAEAVGNAAQAAADNAKKIGEAAQIAADNAKKIGEAAQIAGDQAKQAGEAAQAAADEAKEVADEAKTAGQNAETTANQASTNAQTALNNANNAVDKAAQASQKADNSTTIANEAKAQATTAASNASAALTNAQNAINQVTQIGSDLEDTNGQVSTLTDNLNGFKQTVYTKTQTDTKIATVQSDINGFKTSVSNTYATKSEIQGIKAGVRNYICEVAWTTKGFLATNGSVTNSNDNRVSGFIDVDASKAWIFQQFESATSGSVYVAFYDTNKNLVGSRVTLADGQTGTTASNVTYMRLSTPYKDTFGGRYKFEFGTVKSDWTQAPEDTQFIYTNLQTQVDQTANAVSNKADKTTVDQISGRVDTAEGNITTMAGQINLKANQSTVNAITNRVSATEASLTLQDGKIITLTTKTDGLDTSLTSLTQDYNGFKGTVYTKSQTDTKITTVQASVDQFKTTVSNTYSTKTETQAVKNSVDSLGTKIAYAWSPDGKDRFTRTFGENLASDVLFPFINPFDSGKGHVEIYNSERPKIYRISTDSSAGNWKTFRIISPNKKVKKGDKFTVSFYVRGVNGHSDGSFSQLFNVTLNEFENNNSARYQYWDWFISPDTSFSKFTKTFEIQGDKTEIFSFYFMMSGKTTGGEIFDIQDIQVIFSDTANTIPVSNPQDDYDNSTPRYIGRSLKDSNNPADFTWDPNPERKPWTSYAQGLNGEGLSLMPYGENLIKNSSGSSPIFMGTVGNSTQTIVNNTIKIETTGSTNSGQYLLKSWTTTPLSVGDIVILSFEAKVEKGVFNSFGALEYADTISFNSDKMSDNWFRYIRITKNTETSGAITFYSSVPSIVYIRKVKLELANTMGIPTPWTPAPSEDPLGAIPKYVGTAALPYEDWTKYDWRLSSDWNEVKTSTSIDQTNKAIILKADQTTVNEVSGRVTTAEGKITILSDRMNFRITNSDGSITQIDLANKVISLSGEQVNITGNTYISNGVIKTANIADLAVSTAKIANLAVNEGKIANLAVTNAKIGDLAVNNAKIANLAVSTAKIADLAVTDAKISSLTANKLTAGTIDANVITVKNINASNITSGTIDANVITVKNISASNITGGTMTANRINGGTINGGNVNIINLNASNITSGTISGTNLSINLATGVVNFQKGVIQKTDGKFLIDVTNGVIESYQSSGGFTLNSGEIELRDSSMFNANSGIYGKIGWDLGFFAVTGLCLEGKDGWQLTKTGSKHDIIQRSIGSGIYGNTGLAIFAQDTVSIRGGSLGDGGFQPQILVGCNRDSISQVGPDINIYGKYLRIGSEKGTSINGNLSVISGNLSVTGSKNAIHQVGNDWIATPAYETAESYLGDIGSNQTNESGEVTVNVEYLFSQIVNTNMEYQVFVSSYGEGHVWVEQRYPLFFVVKSSKPNTPFAFEIKAKRKGYEHERLVKQVA